jgi:hypothetical protein
MSDTKSMNQPGANGTSPPLMVAKDPAYQRQSEAPELIRTDAGDITAATVSMDRSGAEQITADRVSLQQSGAKSIQTKSAQLERSGVLALASDHSVLHNSSAIAVKTSEARIVKSRILFFRSDTTRVEGELKSLIHIGQACDGVKPVFDGQGALRFGAALGFVLIVFGRLMRQVAGGR